MATAGKGQLTSEELAAYLEGEVTPFEANRMEQQLRESVASRRELNSMLQIRDALVQPISELEGLDLVPSLRTAIPRDAARAVERRRVHWSTVLPWVIAAASLCLVVGLGVNHLGVDTESAKLGHARVDPARSLDPNAASDAEFRAKSSFSDADPARWTGLQIYRVRPGGHPERVQKRISRGDGLLFSYTNLGRAHYDYLMVFAVDARREVRWCHPAYEHAGENPASIRIAAGEADVPLPDLIHHDFAAGPLQIHALFSAQPMNVLAVEAAVAQGGPNERLALPAAVDQVLTLEVEP